MLKSTMKLMFKIHHFFDEIGYNPTSENFKHENVLAKTIITINHAKEFEDALIVAKLYVYYAKYVDKFVKKLSKYSNIWDESFKYQGRSEVAIVSDNEACGSYYITNIYSRNYKNVYVASQSLGANVFLFKKKGTYFSFDDDTDYFLRYAALSSKKMVIVNKSEKIIANVVLNDSLEISLEDNKTKYELLTYEVGIAFYEKLYINSIKNEPDLKKCKGFIWWDVLDDDANCGLSRLDVFDENSDIDLMITIAASCFLVFRSYVQESKARPFLSHLILMSALRGIKR